jgi:ATP-binding cassette subfamily B multidrug efflux pump
MDLPLGLGLMHEEDVLGKAYDSRLMRRLLDYLLPYRRMVLFALVLIMVESLIEISFPWLTLLAVDNYILAGDMSGLGLIAAVYFGLLVAKYGIGFLQTYTLQTTGQRIMFDMRGQIFKHIQSLSNSFFDRNPVGRLITRVTTDVDVLNEMFSSGIVSVFGDIFTLTGIMIVLLVLDWRLGLIVVLIVPFIGVATAVFRRKARDGYRRVRIAIAKINAFLQEHITGMSVVQLYNRERKSAKRFDDINHEHLVATLDSILAYAVFYPVVELLSATAIALIIWYGGGQVLTGILTLGTLIAFIQYSQRFFRPIADLSEKYNILQSAMASSERIFKLLDTPPTVVSPASPKVIVEARGEIEFQNVWFAYNDEDWILKDVSFRVAPGESIAIVGHTGAGKTTITSLLTRFYDIQKGRILLDGVDISAMDLDDMRRRFAVVLQDVFVFSGTLESNIRLGSDISPARVLQATNDVNLGPFIASLEKGLEHPVNERGTTLSVGQRQLLAFARALAHDPEILILDEATSSVDTETEGQIRTAIERLMSGRTSIIIAHRLSTIQRCDKIIVMHKGRIREIGSHQQLLAQRGLYFKLYQLQYKEQEFAIVGGGAEVTEATRDE